jgi:hypothetical protein
MRIATTRAFFFALLLLTVTPPCQAYWQASAVFAGQVVGVSRVKVKEGGGSYDQRSFRFAVERAYRGVQGDFVEVQTGLGGGDCGYHFEMGERYLVYGYARKDGDPISTGICTRTAPLAGASEDLQYIAGLSRPKGGGVIFGGVSKPRRETRDDGGQQIKVNVQVPQAGVKVSVAGEGGTYEASTDAAGRFRFEALPAGEYVLRLVPPETLYVYGPERKVKIGDGGCAVEHFTVESNGRLTGVVYDAEGRPFARAALLLSEAEHGKDRWRGHIAHATSDAEGRYKFEGVPPGRYILNMRFDGQETSSASPFPNVYHPRTRDPSEAAVIEIGEGELINDYHLRLPPPPAERLVEGVVVWPDGSPAEGVNLNYRASGHEHASYGVKIAAGGRFSFKAYEGLVYTIQASYRSAKGEWVASQTFTVPEAGAVGPVRVIVPRR